MGAVQPGLEFGDRAVHARQAWISSGLAGALGQPRVLISELAKPSGGNDRVCTSALTPPFRGAYVPWWVVCDH